MDEPLIDATLLNRPVRKQCSKMFTIVLTAIITSAPVERPKIDEILLSIFCHVKIALFLMPEKNSLFQSNGFTVAKSELMAWIEP